MEEGYDGGGVPVSDAMCKGLLSTPLACINFLIECGEKMAKKQSRCRRGKSVVPFSLRQLKVAIRQSHVTVWRDECIDGAGGGGGGHGDGDVCGSDDGGGGGRPCAMAYVHAASSDGFADDFKALVEQTMLTGASTHPECRSRHVAEGYQNCKHQANEMWPYQARLELAERLNAAVKVSLEQGLQYLREERVNVCAELLRQRHGDAPIDLQSFEASYVIQRCPGSAGTWTTTDSSCVIIRKGMEEEANKFMTQYGLCAILESRDECDAVRDLDFDPLVLIVPVKDQEAMGERVFAKH